MARLESAPSNMALNATYARAIIAIQAKEHVNTARFA
jgi:hypothetical protein